MWAGSHVFFWLSGVPPLTHSEAPIGSAHLPLLALTAVYFLVNSGLIAMAIGLDARRSPIAVWREHFLWLSVNYFAAASVSFCLVLLMYQASLPAAIVVLPLLVVLHLTLAFVVRAPRRCAAASRASRSPVPVDRRNAGHGDRRQRRRDAQPRAPRAGLRARARARARCHR